MTVTQVHRVWDAGTGQIQHGPARLRGAGSPSPHRADARPSVQRTVVLFAGQREAQGAVTNLQKPPFPFSNLEFPKCVRG